MALRNDPLPCPPSPISLPHLLLSEEGGDSQEDIFSSALALLDPQATSNQHGDPGAAVTYNARNRTPLQLRLSDPGRETERRLFAHYVWNAGLLLAECVGRGWWWRRLPGGCRTAAADWRVGGKDVLELGAGTGLAGMCAGLAGARRVTITDYPTPSILAALEANIAVNVPRGAGCEVTVQGHEWGSFDSEWATENSASYDIVLAADTLWVEHAHAAQAESIAFFLRHTPSSQAWVVAGFHTGRPKVRQFLEDELPRVGLAVTQGWEVDVDGCERPWDGQRQEGFGDGSRWSVVAQVGWKEYRPQSWSAP